MPLKHFIEAPGALWANQRQPYSDADESLQRDVIWVADHWLDAWDSRVCLICTSDLLRGVSAGLNVSLPGDCFSFPYTSPTFPFFLLSISGSFTFTSFLLCSSPPALLCSVYTILASCYVFPSIAPLLPPLASFFLLRAFYSFFFILQADCLWTWKFCPALCCPASPIIKDWMWERQSFCLIPH